MRKRTRFWTREQDDGCLVGSLGVLGAQQDGVYRDGGRGEAHQGCELQVRGKYIEESNKDEMTQFGLYNFMRLSVGVRMVGNYNR